MIHKKKILIRCIVDKKKGFGNFNRSLILAEELKKFNFDVFFLIENNQLAINEITKRKFAFKIIPKSKSMINAGKFIVKFMKLSYFDYIILDMREYGQFLSRLLFKNKIKTILLDDAWCNIAYADLIINGTPTKTYHNYKKINSKTRILSGSKYFIIQPEFLLYNKKNSDIVDKKIYNIVISMGGSDPDNLTSMVTKSLLEIKNIKIKIILGPHYRYQKHLENMIKNKNNITIKTAPKNIWLYFSKADVAISNSGNTLFEFAVIGIPTICISAVKHQIPYGDLFASKGFAVHLGFWKKVTNQAVTNKLNLLLKNRKMRKKMSFMGNKIMDGKGLKIVVNEIVAFANAH